MALDEFTLENPDGSLAPADLLQRGFRYALSLTQNAHDAEDLVHAAWLKLARRYREVSSRALLFVAIRNAYIDHARQRNRREMVSLDEIAEELPAPSLDLAAPADLAILLQTLRPVEREALFLHHVEGYTADEIARFTGSPRNTVLSLLSRAMKKLHVLQKD